MKTAAQNVSNSMYQIACRTSIVAAAASDGLKINRISSRQTSGLRDPPLSSPLCKSTYAPSGLLSSGQPQVGDAGLLCPFPRRCRRRASGCRGAPSWIIGSEQDATAPALLACRRAPLDPRRLTGGPARGGASEAAIRACAWPARALRMRRQRLRSSSSPPATRTTTSLTLLGLLKPPFVRDIDLLLSPVRTPVRVQDTQAHSGRYVDIRGGRRWPKLPPAARLALGLAPETAGSRAIGGYLGEGGPGAGP